MNLRTNRRFFAFFLLAVLGMSALGVGMPARAEAQEAPAYEIGLFSWDEGCVEGTKRAKLYMMMNLLGITELYQEFEEDGLERSTVADFLHDLKLMDVDCYYLAGSRWWGVDPKGGEMLECVKAVAEYNQRRPEAPLTGICFDVETFLVPDWDEDPDLVMEQQVAAHCAAYEAAKEAGLRVIACLPVWYDEQNQSEGLKTIIRDGCDEASMMNYNRLTEYERIAFEVEYARELDKPITCIFEYQRPGKHGLIETDTYYNVGIPESIESFETLYKAFGYEKLKFAYHYLLPLLRMMDAE